MVKNNSQTPVWNRRAFILASLGTAYFAKTRFGPERIRVGHSEYVRLSEFDFTLKAKMDTGAQTTSVNATNISISGPEGQQQVAFQIVLKGELSEPITRPLEDTVKIKGKGANPSIGRPEVMLTLQIGNREIVTRVNLADRSRFSTDLLIGQNTMEQLNLMVDPTSEFVLPNPSTESGLLTLFGMKPR